jgi:NAD(P)-dependent dehydrogenase (short-subunit alcohol dehydrogenase family)
LGLQDRVVVVAAVDAVDREACMAALGGEGCRVVTVEGLALAAAAVEEAGQAHGRVDAVVVYLPPGRGRTVLEAGLEELYDSWASVEAVAAAFRTAVPGMSERRWGRLVSVTTGAVKWLRDQADEPAALAGLGVLGLHKAAVADVAQLGISVNAVLRDADATPEEVAATVAFLLSDSAGYLQGVTISLDGPRSPAMF